MPKSCGVRRAVPNNTLCQKRKYNVIIFGLYFKRYTYKTIHPTNYIFHKTNVLLHINQHRTPHAATFAYCDAHSGVR